MYALRVHKRKNNSMIAEATLSNKRRVFIIAETIKFRITEAQNKTKLSQFVISNSIS